MESQLRASLIQWLRDDPALAGHINAFTEEAPLEANPPWLGIAASASADWSVKTRKGREVRIALELHLRSDDAAVASALIQSIDERIEAFPRIQPHFEIASSVFLRARAEQRSRHRRAVLIEHRFRLLAPDAA